MGGGGGGAPGKKSANFELNLVPFIDLFSTLICFLLITAAWNELDALSTGAPPAMNAESNPNDPPPPPEKKVILSVSLLTDRLDIAEEERITQIPHAGGNPDYEKLKLLLEQWKQRYPERKDLILNTDSRAPYKHLIGLMDTMIAGSFPDVGINLN